MKLTDSELEDIATRVCSATGLRKKELAQEVLELRQANTRLKEKDQLLCADIQRLREQERRGLEDWTNLRAENTRLGEEVKEAKAQAEHNAWACGENQKLYADEKERNTPLREALAKVESLAATLEEGRARILASHTEPTDAHGAQAAKAALGNLVQHVATTLRTILGEAPAVTGTTSDNPPFRLPAEELLGHIRWMAQTAHQAYHLEDPGTWDQTCPKDICASTRAALKLLGAPRG